VKASQEVTRPLKRISLRLQVSIGSQATSDMMLPPYAAGKKMSKVLLSRPSTAVAHLVSVPLV
jgi:hypothetical protein